MATETDKSLADQYAKAGMKWLDERFGFPAWVPQIVPNDRGQVGIGFSLTLPKAPEAVAESDEWHDYTSFKKQIEHFSSFHGLKDMFEYRESHEGGETIRQLVFKPVPLEQFGLAILQLNRVSEYSLFEDFGKLLGKSSLVELSECLADPDVVAERKRFDTNVYDFSHVFKGSIPHHLTELGDDVPLDAEAMIAACKDSRKHRPHFAAAEFILKPFADIAPVLAPRINGYRMRLSADYTFNALKDVTGLDGKYWDFQGTRKQYASDPDVIRFKTDHLSEAEVRELREKLADVANQAVRGVDGVEEHRFFPSTLGQGGYYSKHTESIELEAAAIFFLQRSGIKLDLASIVQPYIHLQAEREATLKSMVPRIDKISGYPAWEQHFSGQRNDPRNQNARIYLKLELPLTEETEEDLGRTRVYGTDMLDPPLSFAKRIREFIAEHDLGGFVEYRDNEVRDPWAHLYINAESVEEMQANLGKLENLSVEFQTMMRDVLLMADPLQVFNRLNRGTLNTVFEKMGGGGPVFEVFERELEEPGVLDHFNLARLVCVGKSVRTGLRSIEAIHRDGDTDEKDRRYIEEGLEGITKAIPALTPAIKPVLARMKSSEMAL